MNARENHEQAMNLCAEATKLQFKEKYDEAKEKYKEALSHEIKALDLLAEDTTTGLGYFILARSAATIAMDAGNLRYAEQLATTALAKDDPEWEIVPELRDVLANVYSLMGMEQFNPEYAYAIRKLMLTNADAVEITNFIRKREKGLS